MMGMPPMLMRRITQQPARCREDERTGTDVIASRRSWPIR
jgi:hypothetical protein